MEKGILILALGHVYYGRLAAGLASTIKCADPTISISLAYAGDALNRLSQKELAMFDSIIAIPEGYYQVKNQNRYLRAKLFINHLSPYNQTLFLDADIAWFNRSPMEIFNLCAGRQVVIKNFGWQIMEKMIDNPQAWALDSDIRIAYGLSKEKCYNLSSEAIYFKKGQVIDQLLSAALQVFDNPKIPYRDFAGYMPDELALSIASMQTGIYPEIDNWEPIFWRQSNKSKMVPSSLRESFYGFSMGGKIAIESEQSIYNSLIGAAYHKLGIALPHKWKNKNLWLKERKKV